MRAPRPPLWQRLALSSGCLLLTLALVPRWLCGRDADAMFDGDAELQEPMARHLARVIAARPERQFYATGSARFDGQSAIAAYQMAILGLGQVVLQHPERRAQYLPAMQAAVVQ